MLDNNLIQKFGYAEMYEWASTPQDTSRFGKFVQFDANYPEKIKFCSNANDVFGVSTINCVENSDDPSEWHGKNLSNEYGDLYLRKERLAVGQKDYDQLKEISFIRTRPWEHHIPIQSEDYDPNRKYNARTERTEWVRVNLMGKCIVEDNGKCKAGEYCTPYEGKLYKKMGTAIPAKKNSTVKYYVLKRLTDKTILIYFK